MRERGVGIPPRARRTPEVIVRRLPRGVALGAAIPLTIYVVVQLDSSCSIRHRRLKGPPRKGREPCGRTVSETGGCTESHAVVRVGGQYRSVAATGSEAVLSSFAGLFPRVFPWSTWFGRWRDHPDRRPTVGPLSFSRTRVGSDAVRVKRARLTDMPVRGIVPTTYVVLDHIRT